ncbi:DUF2335 domain-containing protein [Comamonas odontotermitis]|uniref:DUF2335 domain-containing protein n=1 Tax=Comamonas odontotermitis TaxID=379895 RepID=UPI00366C0139
MAGATSTVTRQVTTAHSGPLPAPETLAGYDQVLPGAAERILCMAEKQQESRIVLEEAQLNADINHRNEMVANQRRVHTGAFISDYIGQALGFLVAAASLGFAAYAGIVKDNWVVAGLFLSLPVVGMIQAVRGMKSKPKDEKPNRD